MKTYKISGVDQNGVEFEHEVESKNQPTALSILEIQMQELGLKIIRVYGVIRVNTKK